MKSRPPRRANRFLQLLYVLVATLATSLPVGLVPLAYAANSDDRISTNNVEEGLFQPDKEEAANLDSYSSFWFISLWGMAMVEALIIAVLLRNRKKYKMARQLLQQSQHDLERRVVERTNKLRTLNNKLYEEIAKHEKTEELLRESQEYINSIINSMPSILIGVTPSGAVTHWNSSAEQATDIRASNALGHLLHEVYPNLPISLNVIKEAIENNIAKVLENVQYSEGAYTDISVYPLVSKKLSGAVIRIDDVTVRVQLENMMIQTEKMMSLGELAAGTAHEINNPLSAILQGVQNIERRLSPDLKKNVEIADTLGITVERVRLYLERREIIQFIAAIREAGERASHIVKNMLEFSRSNNPNHQLVNLKILVENTLELAESSFELDAGIQFERIIIERDFAEDLPPINCSGAEIQQVLLNLLRNSSQALHAQTIAGEQPKIKLRISHDSDYAILEVADNGPGIPEEFKRRIFEPFFTTKEVGKGTGLGLSVSYFIITEHHGGTIEVESNTGEGTRFIIRLPLY